MGVPRRQTDIAADMRRALAISEPELDTTVGSTVRKIIDAVSEQIAEASVDIFLFDYQYDIDTKVGADLDAFVALFGFSRIAAKRATGTVVFERPAGTILAPIMIPGGTQIATFDSPRITFTTTTTAVIGTSSTTVEIPVRCVQAGTVGNVSSGAIRQWIQPVTGIASFSNQLATSGGEDAESDEGLRNRFKRTVFRGLAGTESMFVGIALQDQDVSRVNVIGAAKRRHEQIQIVAGTGTSTIGNVLYVFPDSSIFGADIQDGDILREGVHYGFSASLSGPVITVINSTIVPNGVYQLEFEYLPLTSRNRPDLGITNRVDIYVNGTRSIQAVETLRWDNNKVFNNTTTSDYYRQNYVRPDGSAPANNNFFIPYSFTPVLDPSNDPALGSGLLVGGTLYTKNDDYFLVQDIGPWGGLARGRSGIEWVSNGNGASPANPTVGATFVASYQYNDIPTAIEATLNRWRLVTTDVRVHSARRALLNLYMAAMYDEGYDPVAVRDQVFTALAAFIDSIDFDQTVQASDILAIAHGVPGVDAIRFRTNAENGTNYAIQRVAENGTTILTTYADVGTSPMRASDVILKDNEIAILNGLVIDTKAQNTFGAA